MTRLLDQMAPCGPVIDAGAAARAFDRLEPSAEGAGWAADLRHAWPALAPVFGASPYLAALATRAPERRVPGRPPGSARSPPGPCGAAANAG